ncbi:hypothetical protein QBC38DRAFT_460529 [Podospora fimiseda]|uniref:CFEM domain-containing protein n=1 Tax=Podospora fimiseda TaxID=252190 RepID=A0AAN6YQL6_9PEZI|nr:hypothetical protein QBC38DRAFT_460529 [Podospora fimiseda]
MLLHRDALAIIGLCLLSWLNVVSAYYNDTFLLEARTDDAAALHEMFLSLADCAKPCLEDAFLKTTCGRIEIDCLCADTEFDLRASTCVRKACPVREMLTTKKTLLLLCDKPPKKNNTLIPAFWTFFGLAVLAIVFRVVARVVTTAYFWWDDIAAFFAIACCAAFTVINVESIHAGMGKDVWFVPFDNITKVLRFFYVEMLLYTVTRFFIRSSIILFYLRVFPRKNNNRLGLIIIGTLIFNVIYNVSFFFAVLFQCRPISFFWHAWEGHHDQGHCGNANILAWVAASTGILYDLWLLALPFPQLLKLKLHWRKKIMAGAMFLVGAGVMIISFIRLKTINQFTRTVNPTNDIVDLCLWSGIELDLGIICPCLPSFRLLLQRLFPSVGGSTVGRYELEGNKSTTMKSQSHGPITVEKSVHTDKTSYPANETNRMRRSESLKGLVETSDEENVMTRLPRQGFTTTTITGGRR